MPSQNSNNILALDIGATNTRIALVSPNLEILDIEKISTPKENLKAEIHKLILAFRGNHGNISKLSISAAGPVNNGTVRLTNLPDDEPLTTSDFIAFAKKITLINDASAAALYQARSYQTKNLVFITISSGIGVGVVTSGGVVHFSSTSRELGHMPIESGYNLLCGCGGTNHWESYSSGINIPHFYNAWRKRNRIKPVNITVQDLYQQAEKGDRIAKEFVIEVLGRINSTAIDRIIREYHPEIIVLGGPVILQNLDLFLEGLDPKIRKSTKIVFPAHDEEICLLGAAAYMLNTQK